MQDPTPPRLIARGKLMGGGEGWGLTWFLYLCIKGPLGNGLGECLDWQPMRKFINIVGKDDVRRVAV